MVFLVLGRHMLWLGRKAVTVTSGVTGDTFALEVHLDGAGFGVKLDLFSHKLMRHGIEPVIKLNVVVDIHFNLFDLSIFIGMMRKWL